MNARAPCDKRYSIAVLAQRSERIRLLLDNAMRSMDINADISDYSGGKYDILAAFDTRFPVRKISPCEGCVPIIYSGSGRVRRALSGCGLPCVSCGTAAYDTITVSSLSRGRAMLTVQRELSLPGGGTLEPCELPMRFSGCDIYKALLCASVLLVCGASPDSGGIIISPGASPRRGR